MGLSREEIRVILDEPTQGQIDRFRIDFKPRFFTFQVIREENLIRAIQAAVFVLTDWEVEQVAFLPVDGNPNGVQVTIRRSAPEFQHSGLAVPALRVAGSVIVAITVIYTVHSITRLGTAITKASPVAASQLASGFQLGALALVLGIGFIIYRTVT